MLLNIYFDFWKNNLIFHIAGINKDDSMAEEQDDDEISGSENQTMDDDEDEDDWVILFIVFDHFDLGCG